MNSSLTPLLILFVTVLLPACSALTDTSPPKTKGEMEAEARSGKVPDTIRDPRPEMPPVGPLSMPMR